MMNFIFLNVICPFCGTFAFAVLFCVPKKYYLQCGLTGLAGWLVYLLAYQYTSVAMATFFGTLGVVLLSRGLTVIMRCPITMFLVPGIFPLIPGAGVYNTAFYLVTSQLDKASASGLNAIKVAFAIVAGIVFVVPIPRELFRLEYWRRKIG
ncbi:uncharacterized membrane protein YjjB (DUF3815 family) [Lachnospiraceae bacterium PF1-22]|nr:threonine/serine exporter family protein [Lachnospiraceae bacterium OttesenSCG-928-J05]